MNVLLLPGLALAGLFPQDPPVPTPTPPPAPPQNTIPECKDMKKTASGLEIGFLQRGKDGPSPGPNDTVSVHYTGWFPDGKEFDSSRSRGEPTTFPVGGVIKGWTEALQLMTEGARCKLVIPPDLAYGPDGMPPRIPGNATLVFDVELVKVVRMPTYRAPDAAAQKALPSGIKYEVVTEGTGDVVRAADSVSLRYAIWKPKPDGEAAPAADLLDCSERQRDQRIMGTPSMMPFPFLGELAAVCKSGTVLRAAVPASVWPNARGDTVWELEATAIKRDALPPFRALDRAKIVTTQTGLQYEVIEPGTGDAPKTTDSVAALYTGWLTDGTTFDSAHARGEPSTFPLRGVIPGWTEGLQLMKPGAKFLFQIPAELGYGAKGSPPKIPANATLVFLIELVEINPKPKGSR